MRSLRTPHEHISHTNTQADDYVDLSCPGGQVAAAQIKSSMMLNQDKHPNWKVRPRHLTLALAQRALRIR